MTLCQNSSSISDGMYILGAMMLQKAFYSVGIVTCCAYLAKEVSDQIASAKERKFARNAKQFIEEAKRIHAEAQARTDDLLPQIELTWEETGKSVVEKFFTTEHARQVEHGADHDEESCLREMLRHFKQVYTQYVIDRLVEPYRKRVVEAKEQLGASHLETVIGCSDEEVGELREQLVTCGFDIDELDRQFA